MVRILFGVLLFGYGLIHIIGFASEWISGSLSFVRDYTLFPLDDVAARIAGVMWLITAMLWLTSTFLYLLKRDYFWKVALLSLIISQILIVVYWPFTKFGTIMNVLVLGVVILNIARINFNRNVNREWNRLTAARKIIGENKESRLPSIVSKWLSATKSGSKVPSKVILTQRGAMRPKPSAEWMNFSATQFYTVDPPAFLWNSNINAGHAITIAGRDKFENGKGNMLIKPLYIYKLANASGVEIDEGTMLRYMGEIIWFPEAANMYYFNWQTLDSTSAELSMTYNGTSAKGVFTFDEEGHVKSFCAERFGDFNGQFRKETWEVKVTDHRLINGHFIGSKCDVTWKLKEGDFTWLKLEVEDIKYEFN